VRRIATIITTQPDGNANDDDYQEDEEPPHSTTAISSRLGHCVNGEEDEKHEDHKNDEPQHFFPSPNCEIIGEMQRDTWHLVASSLVGIRNILYVSVEKWQIKCPTMFPRNISVLLH